jgi:segregation and condensation protein A
MPLPHWLSRLRSSRRISDAFLRPLLSLLDLLRSNKLPAGDVPTGPLSQRFHSYVNMDRPADPAGVAEFAAVASTLTLMKSRRLTPWLQDEDTATIELDSPRDRSSTVRDFEPITAALNARFLDGAEAFPRSDYVAGTSREIELGFLSTTSLGAALRSQLADAAARRLTHVPAPIFLRLEAATRAIQESIHRLARVSFRHMLENNALDRSAAVVYFLAVLELAKTRVVDVYQDEPFDDIVLVPRRGLHRAIGDAEEPARARRAG